jgi:acyl-coenzyme A synthetase/AMP-(fatty) acid ligase
LHKVNILYTAPTAIRALMAEGDKAIEGTDRSSLRILGSVGEPINPVAVRNGRVYDAGAPKDIMTETLVKEVFNLHCRIIDDPYFHTPLCIPFPGEPHAEG